MAINPKFVVTSDLEGIFRDKNSGLPLANGYILFFSDESRNVPKRVYQLNNYPIYGYVDIGSRITLSGVGTPQNNNGDNIVIYYWPYEGLPPPEGIDSNEPELYFVEVYDQNNNLMFTREAWPNPSVSGSTPPSSSNSSQQNQISNPTFTNIFLNSGANVFSFSGAVAVETPIGPDWDLVVSGTGDVTITRELIAGASQIPTSPPYDLLFTVGAGITLCRLKQKFKQNSGLWTSTSAYPLYLTGSFVAQHTTPDLVTLLMFAAPNGLSPVQIVNASVDSNFKFFGGTSVQIPFSTNPSIGTDGFLDVYLELPLSTSIRLSSVNLFPSSVSPSSILPSFDATNRNLDFQSNYYVPELIFKHTPSILTGWDFKLNPCQASSRTGSLGTTSKYIADQTISAFAGAGSIAYLISSTSRFTTTGTNNAFYVLQYLTLPESFKILRSPLSVNIFGYASTTDVVARVYLFRGDFSAAIPTSATGQSIGDVATNGIFTLDGTRGAHWFPLDRNGFSTPFSTLNQVTTFAGTYDSRNDIGFNGWSVKNIATPSDATHFSIVVTFECPTATVVDIESISLVEGNVPCRPAPQAYSEVVRECRYYYQKSFGISVPPQQNLGANTGEAYSILVSDSQTTLAPILCPLITFPTPVRVPPSVLLYNPVAANNQIRDFTANGTGLDLSISSVIDVTTNGFNTIGSTTTNQFKPGDKLGVHWTADARLGVI